MLCRKVWRRESRSGEVVGWKVGRTPLGGGCIVCFCFCFCFFFFFFCFFFFFFGGMSLSRELGERLRGRRRKGDVRTVFSPRGCCGEGAGLGCVEAAAEEKETGAAEVSHVGGEGSHCVRID